MSAGTHNPAAAKKIALCDKYAPAAPMRPAVRALPAAAKRELRPARSEIALRPTRPRLIAAMAGVTAPEVAPCRTSARKTATALGASARISAAVPIMTIPAATRPRFQGAASAKAPPGIWLTTDEMVLIDKARPIMDCGQLRPAK